jgi:hypothetical protein
MNKVVLFICMIITFATGQTCLAQPYKDTILLLNGSTVITTVLDTNFGVVTCKNPKPDKDNLEIEKDRIFSIKRDGQPENVVYEYDTIIGNDYTVDEMRLYIIGEQDATKGVKGRGAFWTNFAIGGVAGLWGQFYSPIAPFAFVACTGFTKVKIKHSTVSNLDYLKHDAYILGYQRVAQNKRKVKSMIGGGIGLAVGFGTDLLLIGTNNNNPLYPQ